jgi:serine/threonine protein kinase/class 3 adenylate cyclase
MNLGRFDLQAQLGAGVDGVSYRAVDPEKESPVEVRVLSGVAVAGEARARKLRLAAMLAHPAARAVCALDLVHEPPYVALEWVEGESLAAALRAAVPLPAAEVVRLGTDLASVLSAAHALGLVHGRLSPATVWRTAAGALKLDFTGLDTGGDPPPAADAPPEQAGSPGADPAADVYGMGALLSWLLTGQPVRAGQPLPSCAAGPVQDLLPRLLAADPLERPSARTALGLLNGRPATDRNGFDPNGTIPSAPALRRHTETEVAAGPELGECLGRFRLLERLGAGGLGRVYRAEDVSDGTVVAIKVLHPHLAGLPQALRRFHKEARLLGEVHNPYVANLVEVNEDHGVHFLALEFVAGQSLGRLLGQRQRLDEPLALALMADVARALLDAHRRGIVHRDIKPDNVMLEELTTETQRHREDKDREELEKREQEASPSALLSSSSSPSSLCLCASVVRSFRVKVCDFGLARHVVESASLNLTGEGTPVGTVLYMSPEQASGRQPVDPRTDVYAMGATLFHLLAGRPPFLADSALALSLMHAQEPPPPLQKLNPAVSDGVCRIVARALAKNPDDRYADAGALLRDLERVLHGEPTDAVVHPQLPRVESGRLRQYDWTWDLESSPEQLWPYVSNTERLNRAVGIPAVQFTAEVEPAGPGLAPGVRRIGTFRKAGFTNTWREHPFEWIEGRRMGVLREYSHGVFRWLATMTELEPRPGGGTTLHHRVRIEPRGLLGRLVAAVEVNFKGRRFVERVYRRIDAFLAGKLGSRALADPFEPPPRLSRGRRRRLDELLDRLRQRGLDPDVVLALGDFLAQAADQEVARIRPLALANRLGLDPEPVVAACLHGAREGLLVLLWDVLCPRCRIPGEIKDTLRALRRHAHCEACNLDFELDFGGAVEMIFRVHPEVRGCELRTYCIGGPVHFPHVAAQVRVGAGERLELALALPAGTYRLRGPQLPHALDFRVEPGALLTRWDVRLAGGPRPEPIPPLQAGRQLLVLANGHAQELLVRIERTAGRADALTASRASALALFRELFPAEVLSAGQLASVATVTLLATDLGPAGHPGQPNNLYAALGDARAFDLLHRHFRHVEECVRRQGGALIKTEGEGVLAAFPGPAAAVQAGLDLPALEAPAPEALCVRPRVAVHRGPAFVATVNDHLDYFGTTVSQVRHLPGLIDGGDMVLTQPVASDPEVVQLLRSRRLESAVLPANLPGQPEGILHRLVLPAPAKDSSQTA